MPLPPNSRLISTGPEAGEQVADRFIVHVSSLAGAARRCQLDLTPALIPVPTLRGNRAMPMLLKGSCRCGAVRFEVDSHTPVPYQLCYCSICRKQQGGGGYAINLGADSATLEGDRQARISASTAPRSRTTSIRIARCRPASGASAANAARRCGSTIRPGRSWCIRSPRRSTANCRRRQSAVHLMLKYKAVLGRAEYRARATRPFDRLSRGIDRRLAQEAAGSGWIEAATSAALWRRSHGQRLRASTLRRR